MTKALIFFAIYLIILYFLVHRKAKEHLEMAEVDSQEYLNKEMDLLVSVLVITIVYVVVVVWVFQF